MANEDAEMLADQGLDGAGVVTEPVPGTTPGEASAPPEQPSGPQQPPQQPQEVIQTESAFLMYVDASGHWVADGSAINRPIQVGREANFNDFYHAACVLKKDVETQEVAQQTVLTQQRVAQQMAERIQTAQVAQGIGGPVGGIDLSKLIKG